jgi:hypothetical protein
VKTCLWCRQERPDREFPLDRRGRARHCRPCRRTKLRRCTRCKVWRSRSGFGQSILKHREARTCAQCRNRIRDMKARRARSVPSKLCRHCRAPFQPIYPGQELCSRRCANLSRRKHGVVSPSVRRRCPDCQQVTLTNPCGHCGIVAQVAA